MNFGEIYIDKSHSFISVSGSLQPGVSWSIPINKPSYEWKVPASDSDKVSFQKSRSRKDRKPLGEIILPTDLGLVFVLILVFLRYHIDKNFYLGHDFIYTNTVKM